MKTSFNLAQLYSQKGALSGWDKPIQIDQLYGFGAQVLRSQKSTKLHPRKGEEVRRDMQRMRTCLVLTQEEDFTTATNHAQLSRFPLEGAKHCKTLGKP